MEVPLLGEGIEKKMFFFFLKGSLSKSKDLGVYGHGDCQLVSLNG